MGLSDLNNGPPETPEAYPKVCIVMSTYNGGKWLAQQMDSLVAQTWPNMCLYVRDDGSSDDTLDILATYQNKLEMTVSPGENLGACDSFLQAMADAPDDAGYYAFCDQDDIWFDDKIARSVEAVSSLDPDTPILLHSQQMVCDDNLGDQQPGRLPLIEATFENALAGNIVTGCTVMIHTSAWQLLKTTRPRRKAIYIHDWWAYLVISLFGRIEFLASPTMLYRQHTSNTSSRYHGNPIKQLYRAFKLFAGGQINAHTHRHVSELQHAFEDLLSEQQKNKLALAADMVSAPGALQRYKSLRQLSPKQRTSALQLFHMIGILVSPARDQRHG